MRVAVVSFLCGDVVKYPSSITGSFADFYLFNNGTPVDGWKTVDITPIVDRFGPYDANKIIKWCPQLFSHYDHIVYHDGNIELTVPPETLIYNTHLSDFGVTLHRHSARTTVAAEIEELLQLKKGNQEALLQFKNELNDMEFTDSVGLAETGLVVFNMPDPKLTEDILFEYALAGTYRDQVVIPLLLELEYGRSVEDLVGFSTSIYDNQFLRFFSSYNRNDNNYSQRSMFKSVSNIRNTLTSAIEHVRELVYPKL